MATALFARREASLTAVSTARRSVRLGIVLKVDDRDRHQTAKNRAFNQPNADPATVNAGASQFRFPKPLQKLGTASRKPIILRNPLAIKERDYA